MQGFRLHSRPPETEYARFPGDSRAHYKLRSRAEHCRKASKWKPWSAPFFQKNTQGLGEALHKSKPWAYYDVQEIGPWPRICSRFGFQFPFFYVSFKSWLPQGVLLDWFLHMRALSFFPTWYPGFYLQMKFLSWALDLCFQQQTKHVCQEAILLSPVPSYQNIQSWTPCSTHSLLCPVSQLPSSLPSTQPPRPDTFSTRVPKSLKSAKQIPLLSAEPFSDSLIACGIMPELLPIDRIQNPQGSGLFLHDRPLMLSPSVFFLLPAPCPLPQFLHF